jgi:hypothetical protein
MKILHREEEGRVIARLARDTGTVDENEYPIYDQLGRCVIWAELWPTLLAALKHAWPDAEVIELADFSEAAVSGVGLMVREKQNQ